MTLYHLRTNGYSGSGGVISRTSSVIIIVLKDLHVIITLIEANIYMYFNPGLVSIVLCSDIYTM